MSGCPDDNHPKCPDDSYPKFLKLYLRPILYGIRNNALHDLTSMKLIVG